MKVESLGTASAPPAPPCGTDGAGEDSLCEDVKRRKRLLNFYFRELARSRRAPAAAAPSAAVPVRRAADGPTRAGAEIVDLYPIKFPMPVHHIKLINIPMHRIKHEISIQSHETARKEAS